MRNEVKEFIENAYGEVLISEVCYDSEHNISTYEFITPFNKGILEVEYDEYNKDLLIFNLIQTSKG
jgi:hypothetical protein